MFPKPCHRIELNSLINRLNTVSDFLTEYSSLTTCHMVNFFTKNLWHTAVPVNIQRECSSELNCDRAIDLFYKFWTVPDSEDSFKEFPALFRYLSLTKSNRIDTMLSDTVLNYLKTDVGPNRFMSPKKCHEVDILTEVILKLCQTTSPVLNVIDAGDGIGYLTAQLSVKYVINCLGIDSNQRHSTRATARVEQMKHHSAPYRTVTEYMTVDSDLKGLFLREFPDNNSKFCLSGLHTCGNLATTSLRLFIKNHDILTLCNVACCYNFLNEPGEFPISNHLLRKGFQLGRNPRMLAAQSLPRQLNNQKIHPHIRYRAMFELLWNRLYTKQSPEIGRIRKECQSFTDYTEQCFQKLSIKQSIDEIVIQEIENSIKVVKRLELFYLLRMCLADGIEMVILLDRLLYLRENGIENSTIFKLFDPVISPKCFGIIANKNI